MPTITAKRPGSKRCRALQKAEKGEEANACEQELSTKIGTGLASAEKRHHRPHMKKWREEADSKGKKPGYNARRWVVERTHSWFNRFRKLFVSFEMTKQDCVALLALAAATICWCQTIVVY